MKNKTFIFIDRTNFNFQQTENNVDGATSGLKINWNKNRKIMLSLLLTRFILLVRRPLRTSILIDEHSSVVRRVEVDLFLC